MFDVLFSLLDKNSLPKVRLAIETCRWPSGAPMSKEDQSRCLEKLIEWEAQNLPEEERSGFMPTKCASQNGKTDTSILRFKDDV